METAEQPSEDQATKSSPNSSQPASTAASADKPELIVPDLEFIQETRLQAGESFKKCFQCATCSATCPISPDEAPFPRKEMMWAVWGMKERLVKDPDIWLCYQCNDCSVQCPRDAKPGDVLSAARSFSLQHYAFPRILGKMVASPWALPILLGIPVVLILALKFITGHVGFPGGEIVFEKFFPHHALDPMFIAAALWAVFASAIALARFWIDMQNGTPPPGQAAKTGFVASLVASFREIALHGKFRECDVAGARNLSHLLTFYGFIGLFITTTFVFFGLYAPKVLGQIGIAFPELTPLPLKLYHPVKILGNVSAIVFAAGLALMAIQRVSNKDKAGVTNYYDALFLGVMCVLAVTGIAAQLARLAGLAVLAYSIYFIHLTFVFFLLAYLPYSKFAHILYRTIAIFHAKRSGRI